MGKGTKSMLWIVAGLATLGIGAGIALWYYGKKHPKEADAVPAEKDASGEPSLDATPVTKVNFGTDVPQDADSIKAFQTWVNNYKKPNPLLKVDGIWGAKSQAQWDLYSKDYAKRNRTVAGGGSGIAFGSALWANRDIVNIYSYPSNESKYLLGYTKKSAKFFGRFGADSSVAGWIKGKFIYTPLKGGSPVVKIAYVQLKDVTTVAP